MCSRKEARDAQEAQDAAAVALVNACRGVCTDDIGVALHKLYDTTVSEPVPPAFNELLWRLS